MLKNTSIPDEYKKSGIKLLYGLYEPESSVPFYIGYGTYRRPNVHWNKFRRGERLSNEILEAKLVSLAQKPIIKILAVYNDLDAIKCAEVNAIKAYGMIKDGGSLCNAVYNNSGASSEGAKKSRNRPEVLAKVSAAMKIAQSKPETNSKRSASLKKWHLENPGISKFSIATEEERRLHSERTRRGIAKARALRLKKEI